MKLPKLQQLQPRKSFLSQGQAVKHPLQNVTKPDVQNVQGHVRFGQQSRGMCFRELILVTSFTPFAERWQIFCVGDPYLVQGTCCRQCVDSSADRKLYRWSQFSYCFHTSNIQIWKFGAVIVQMSMTKNAVNVRRN
jgi:hypothetical protein